MSQIVGLPVYLPVRVKVALGLVETDDLVAFQKWKRQQYEVCTSFGAQQFTPCTGTDDAKIITPNFARFNRSGLNAACETKRLLC